MIHFFPNSERLRTVYSVIITWVLAAIWVTAGVTKLTLIDQFKDVVKTIIPGLRAMAPAICFIVIGCEVLTAVTLLVPRSRQIGMILTCALSAAFAAVNLIRINEGIHAPCSCFGKIFVMSPVAALVLDIAMLLAASSFIGAKPALGVQL